jgi:hypothetical protein
MKNIKIHFFVILFFAGILTYPALAQVNATSQVFAEVSEALAATETSQLNFGKFFPQGEGGEIQITPEGVRLVEGSVTLTGGAHSSASYEITGEDGVSFTIILPPTPVILTNIDNSKTMIVDNWQSIPPPGQATGQLDGGTQQVNMGATLNVGPVDENPVGMYAGTYSITFSYN